MKYYNLRRGGEETKYPDPELFGEWENESLWMNEWENRNLKLPVTMTVKNKYAPDDYPLADSNLISGKFLKIVRELNTDFEALPTQLYYKGKDPVWDIYYSMIFPEYNILNMDKSEYEYFEGVLDLLGKVVLDKGKLSDIHNNIFAMKEKSIYIICTETAKDMIETAGIKGVRFTELPVE